LHHTYFQTHIRIKIVEGQNLINKGFLPTGDKFFFAMKDEFTFIAKGKKQKKDGKKGRNLRG